MVHKKKGMCEANELSNETEIKREKKTKIIHLIN